MSLGGKARAKFLCDSERCIECNACVTACKNENEVPWGINRRRVVTINDGKPGERSISVACMHCSDAPCMAVCPVDCFYQTDDGVVLHSKDLCIGCGYCFYACPFGAPQFPQAGNFGSRGKMDKCTFCAGGPEEDNSQAEFQKYGSNRIAEGKLPSCAEQCATKALLAGDGDDVAAIYRERVVTRGFGSGAWGWGTAYGEERRLTAIQKGGDLPAPLIINSTIIPEVIMNLKVVGACLAALLTFAVTPAHSQDEGQRASTGGAQTLEDILARQKGLEVEESFRRDNLGNPENAQPMSDNLGVLGGVSSSDLYRGIRYAETDVKVSNNSHASEVLVQDGGMGWLLTRQGGIQAFAGYGIGGIIVALAAFYFLRGRMAIEGGPSGETIERFKAFERFGHWCLAGSFIMLAITGLLLLFGRSVIIPVFGHEANSAIANLSIWVHNNIAWVFMASLVAIFVMWVAHNIPTKLDLQWFAKGGGIVGNAHPSARKFNGGQKLIFWMTVILGASVSMSGLSLLFPFEFPMFASTFEVINTIVPAMGLETNLLPHEEMQLAHLWHAIVATTMIIAIVAHIYIGSVGMEGAFDAMGNGQVDLEWARQHHDLWVEEEEAKGVPIQKVGDLR